MAVTDIEFTTTGIVVPTPIEVRDSVAETIKDIFKNENGEEINTDRGVVGQIVDFFSAEIINKNTKLAYLANQLNPRTASGQFLDAHAKIYFLQRKLAEPSVVQCVCRGIAGTTIPFGAQAKTDDDIVVYNTGTFTLGADGTAVGNFATQERSSIPIDAGAINSIITSVIGWDSITNPAPASIWRVEESDAELRARLYQSVANNAWGYLQAIRGGIASVDGVLGSIVLENPTSLPIQEYGVSIPAHSICVSVNGGTDEDIARAISRYKSDGCGTYGTTQVHFAENGQDYYWNIIRPVETPLKFKIILSNNISATTENMIKDAVMRECLGEGVTNKTRIIMAQTVYPYRFSTSIQNILQAESELVGIQVALGGGDFDNYVTINATVMPTFSKDNITITT